MRVLAPTRWASPFGIGRRDRLAQAASRSVARRTYGRRSDCPRPCASCASERVTIDRAFGIDRFVSASPAGRDSADGHAASDHGRASRHSAFGSAHGAPTCREPALHAARHRTPGTNRCSSAAPTGTRARGGPCRTDATPARPAANPGGARATVRNRNAAPAGCRSATTARHSTRSAHAGAPARGGVSQRPAHPASARPAVRARASISAR